MDKTGSKDEELFSMDDLEKDLKKGRPPRRLTWFGAGLILGIAGTILVPIFLAPYLPAVFSGNKEILSGPVLAKERDGDRLLLTIQTEPGALIASFSERVSEIGMLVEPGDTVTIAVDDYDPFVTDPDFEGVKKGTPPGDARPGTSESSAGEGDAAGDAAEGDPPEGDVGEGDAPEGDVGEGDGNADPAAGEAAGSDTSAVTPRAS